MSRTAQALLLAATCSLATGAARADVIYTFTGDPAWFRIGLNQVTRARESTGL